MVRLRIEGDSADEVKAVADTIESLFPQYVVFSPAKEGANPKYTSQQKFFSYATLQLNPLSSKKS